MNLRIPAPELEEGLVLKALSFERRSVMIGVRDERYFSETVHGPQDFVIAISSNPYRGNLKGTLRAHSKSTSK